MHSSRLELVESYIFWYLFLKDDSPVSIYMLPECTILYAIYTTKSTR